MFFICKNLITRKGSEKNKMSILNFLYGERNYFANFHFGFMTRRLPPVSVVLFSEYVISFPDLV